MPRESARLVVRKQGYLRLSCRKLGFLRGWLRCHLCKANRGKANRGKANRALSRHRLKRMIKNPRGPIRRLLKAIHLGFALDASLLSRKSLCLRV